MFDGAVRAVVIVSLAAFLASGPYPIRAHADREEGTAPAPDAEYAEQVASALSAYEAGRFRDARAWFERAHARWPSARTLWGLGVTAFELGRHAQAIEELRAALEDARLPLDAQKREQARDIIARAERHVGYVHVELAPKGARLWLDGTQTQSRDLTLAPGEYTLFARAPNFSDGQQLVSVVAGERREVKLTLTPLDLSVHAAAASSDAATRHAPLRDTDEDGGVLTRWWFWTALGVVVAGGVTAAVIAASGEDEGVRVDVWGTPLMRQR